jgi:hypothetical protein
MAEERSNLKSLSKEDRERLRTQLTDSLELLELQARIAEARARIKKAEVESIIYSVEAEKFKNGTPNNDNREKTNGKGSREASNLSVS